MHCHLMTQVPHGTPLCRPTQGADHCHYYKSQHHTAHPAAYGVHCVPAVHMCASVPKHIIRLTTATTTRPSTTQHIQQRTAFTGCLQCTGVI